MGLNLLVRAPRRRSRSLSLSFNPMNRLCAQILSRRFRDRGDDPSMTIQLHSGIRNCHPCALPGRRDGYRCHCYDLSSRCPADFGMSHGIDDREASLRRLVSLRRNSRRRRHASAPRVNRYHLGSFMRNGAPIGQRTRLRSFEFRHIRHPRSLCRIPHLGGYWPVPGILPRSRKRQPCGRNANQENRNPHTHVVPLTRQPAA